ncbi:MAG: hypothetical protein GY940_20200, partial [bacterium]|nr:hypothetical protein [bacterium]
MIKTKKDLDKLAIAAGQKVKEKEYWLKKLSGDPPKSVFPYDHKKEGNREAAWNSVGFAWEGELVSRLKKLTGHSDVRLHMVLVTGVTVLLAKYSNNTDIVIATPVFHSGKENKPGEVETDLLNTIIPLRITMNSSMVFKELLLQVREIVIEAVENQAYPIDILVKQLKQEDPGKNDFPLFDVVVLLENIQHNQWAHHTDPNIIFAFRSTESGIDGRLEYNALLYEDESPRRKIRHLSQLLEKMLDNADTPLSKMDVLNPQERQQLLFDFNGTSVDFPRDKTMVELWQEQVEKTPDSTA